MVNLGFARAVLSLVQAMIGYDPGSYAGLLAITVKNLRKWYETLKAGEPLQDLYGYLSPSALGDNTPVYYHEYNAGSVHVSSVHGPIHSRGKGCCRLVLYRISNGSLRTWLLHIEERLEFSFNADQKGPESNSRKTLRQAGLIRNGDFCMAAGDLFSSDTDSSLEVKRNYLEAYARWGQCAWHGLSMGSSNGAERIVVLVWPRVWWGENRLLKWENPEAVPLLGPLGTNEPHIRVFLNGDSSVGNLYAPEWGALVNDVMSVTQNVDGRSDEEKMRPDGQLDVLNRPVLGGNAAHEFGHMMTAQHALPSVCPLMVSGSVHSTQHKNRMNHSRGNIEVLTGPLKWAYDTTGGSQGGLGWLRDFFEST